MHCVDLVNSVSDCTSWGMLNPGDITAVLPETLPPSQRPLVDKKKRKECEMEGCTIVPVFNYQGESSGRFCKAHRWSPSLGLLG